MRHLRTNSKWLVGLLASLMLAAGCKTTQAPTGYLPDPREMKTHPYGGWADVYLKPMSEVKVPADSLPPPMQTDMFNPDIPYSGELLAVDRDTLYIKTSQGLAKLPRQYIHNVDLQGYDSGFSFYVGTTIIGVLTTVSHGWFLALSAPLWILFGTIAGSAQSNIPVYEYPDKNSWGELRLFARFPQGIPGEMTHNELDSLFEVKIDTTRIK